jgi:general secretion pathway protein H
LRVGERGYTIIELLVVLAVISLLVAATPAIVSAARPGMRARAETYALADTLRAARTAAIMADAEMIVMFDITNNGYVAPGGKTDYLPTGVEWEFLGQAGISQGDRAEIHFFSDGSSSGGSIRILAAGLDRVITANRLTGRISVDE